MDILIEVLIISTSIALFVTIMCYVSIKIKEYEYYVKETEKGIYSHATFDDFLREFNDRDIRSKHYYDYGFEYLGDDGKSSRCDCGVGCCIVFDGVRMLLNYRDYRKCVRFIKKEIKNRELRDIENRNVRKWGK